MGHVDKITVYSLGPCGHILIKFITKINQICNTCKLVHCTVVH